MKLNCTFSGCKNSRSNSSYDFLYLSLSQSNTAVATANRKAPNMSVIAMPEQRSQSLAARKDRSRQSHVCIGGCVDGPA